MARRVKEGLNHLREYKQLREVPAEIPKSTPLSPKKLHNQVLTVAKKGSPILPSLSNMFLAHPFCWHHAWVASLTHEAIWMKNNLADRGEEKKKSAAF